jgi:glycosyltransferase involved in cell wall biosynthesis
MEKVITVHIINSLITGGAEMMLCNVLLSTDREKFMPVVITLMDDSGWIKDRIETLDIPIYSLGIKGISVSSFFQLLKLKKLMRKIKPDILQGWMYYGNLVATLAGSVAPGNPPVVWNIRHSLADIKLEKRSTRRSIQLNRLFSRDSKAIIYNSNLSQQQHERYGFHPLRSRYIPNGIDIKAFKDSPASKEPVRARYQIPPDAIVVGHAARYHPMKDHQGFLQAAVAIAKTNPAVHFVLIGRDITTDNNILIALIPTEMKKRFHLLGVQNNIPGLMNMMDVFCLSSAWGEGWSNVLGEAMAAGVPCVATDVGDSKEIVGDTGVIVPPQDPELLTQGLEELIKKTPKQRTALGEAARSRIKEKFRIDLIVEQYESLYDGLVKT